MRTGCDHNLTPLPNATDEAAGTHVPIIEYIPVVAAEEMRVVGLLRWARLPLRSAKAYRVHLAKSLADRSPLLSRISVGWLLGSRINVLAASSAFGFMKPYECR